MFPHAQTVSTSLMPRLVKQLKNPTVVEIYNQTFAGEFGSPKLLNVPVSICCIDVLVKIKIEIKFIVVNT